MEDGEKIKSKRSPVSDLTNEEHLAALSATFIGKEIIGYGNMLDALSKGYSSIGFNRGRTIMSKLLSFLIEKQFVVRKGNKFTKKIIREVT